MMSFVLGSTAHGAMIFSRLDYAQTINGGAYGVGLQLMTREAYDPGEGESLRKLLDLRREHFGDGVVMLDCGANIGVHTVECGRHMRGWGGVHAFEAQKRIFYALCGNIAINNIQNANAHHVVLGRSEGVATVPGVSYDEPASYGSLEVDGENEDLGQDLTGRLGNVTKKFTIDWYDFVRVDLIKIDVEGMELAVIDGAANTIRRCQPLIWVEHTKTGIEALQADLAAMGYIASPCGMNLLCFPENAPYVKLEAAGEQESKECTVEKAVTLGNKGAASEAIDILLPYIAEHPHDYKARYNLGTLYMQVNDFGAAITQYTIIIAAARSLHRGTALAFLDLAHFGRGFAQLMLGNLRDGFIGFEYRKKSAVPAELRMRPELMRDGQLRLSTYPDKTWTWDELKGKTILVVGEMGFGDNIMFSRYLCALVDKGLNVVVTVPPQLESLMWCLPYIQVHGPNTPVPDIWVHMMSLARLFETDIDTVPLPTRFELHLSPRGVKWRGAVARQSVAGRLKVGLCWSGSRKSTYDEHRSIPLEKLRRLFDVPGVDYYSLQLDVRDSDVPAYADMPIYNMATDFDDFLDTACAIQALDLVITVDTSVCHLAGSLGVPTWVMLTSFRTYWMWIVGRTDSPWYPGMKAYRQVEDGDWDEVISRIDSDLRCLAGGGSPE